MTGPAAVSGSGLIGLGARSSVLGGLDDLSGTLSPDGQTVIQNALGEQTGNTVKTGLNVLGTVGSGLNIRNTLQNRKGKSNIVSDVISGSLDAKSAVETTNTIIDKKE